MKVYITRYIFILLLAGPVPAAYAQEVNTEKGELTGKIHCPEEGNAIIDFATVYLKDTSFGAVTDGSGVYRFSAPAGQYILTVSAPGYRTEEYRVTVRPGDTLVNRTPECTENGKENAQKTVTSVHRK